MYSLYEDVGFIKKRNFSSEELQMIKNMIEENKSTFYIAKQLNVTPKVIKRYLKENNIKIKDCRRKYYFDENYFEVIDTPEKAYWLGFILADGYNNQDRGFLNINLNSIDHHHLEKFVDAIEGDYNMITIRQHSITGNNMSCLCINSRKMSNDLAKLNILQGKSANEHIPPNIPKILIKDFIRGIIDGDGHINSRRIDIISSIEVLTFIQEYLHETCSININKICDHCNTFRIYICKNRDIVLKHLYYKNCLSLDRKQKIVDTLYI